MRVASFVALLLTALLLAELSAFAIAEEPERTAEAWLTQFADQWNEAAWDHAGEGKGYMRPLDDDDWQQRMLALRGLASLRGEAFRPLVAALKESDTPTRILAAQAMGYLAPRVPGEPLLHAMENDASAAVRLYAVDSLGMQGGADLTSQLTARRQREANRDVRKHIAYAIERKAGPLDPAIATSLIDWDPAAMNSARLGARAPEIHLRTVSGREIRLSQFRGKQPVVLVFIYGDT